MSILMHSNQERAEMRGNFKSSGRPMIHGKTWPMWQIYSSSAEVCRLHLVNAFLSSLIPAKGQNQQPCIWAGTQGEESMTGCLMHEPNTVCWCCIWAPAPLESSHRSCFCLDLAENLPPPSRWIEVGDGQLVHTSDNIMWELDTVHLVELSCCVE